jgi:surface antigen|tara:strand:+ start:148 stop:591 length:444 start_codon:yes stop_codon:yes gene_type:complete
MKAVNGILLLALISILGACSSTSGVQTYNTTDTTTSSVQSTYQPANGYVGVVVNLTKWHWYRLPAEDRMKQEQAVYFALDNVENGDGTSWYNNNTGSNGEVIVVSTYPMGSGYCRVMLSKLNYKGKLRHFKETACRETGHEGWRFLR